MKTVKLVMFSVFSLLGFGIGSISWFEIAHRMKGPVRLYDSAWCVGGLIGFFVGLSLAWVIMKMAEK